jgi:DNA-binding CsgD family transcriptional regulator
VIAAFIYLKTKDKFIRYSLFFYVPFTLVVVFYTALSYIEANVPLIHQNVVIILQYFATTSLLALIFVVPVSVHYLSSVPHATTRNIIFGSIALITYMSYHFIEFVITEETFRRVGENLLQAIFIAVMIYSAITDMYYYKNVQDPVKKRFGKKGAILLGIFLPGLFYDMFFSEISPFRFYPILYCGFSIFFVHYFLTYYFHQSHIPENALPAEDFFEQYNISSREQEIVTLILKGYSNQKIGETLYISLNTVKAHLRNIYPKFGVKSRYELITLVKDVQGNPSTGTEHSSPQ